MNSGTARSIKTCLGEEAYLRYKQTGEHDADLLEFERAIAGYSKPSREIYTKIRNEGTIELSWLRDRFASHTAEDAYISAGTMKVEGDYLVPTHKYYERLGLKYPDQMPTR